MDDITQQIYFKVLMSSKPSLVLAISVIDVPLYIVGRIPNILLGQINIL